MNRSGQWGKAARGKRARRLVKADAQRRREWRLRAEGRQQATLGGRRGRRLFERVVLVLQARNFGVEPKEGEPTKALRYRLRLLTGLRAKEGSRQWLETLTGGKVATNPAIGEVVITMPAGTSADRVAEVEALCAEHVPLHLLAVVRVDGAP